MADLKLLGGAVRGALVFGSMASGEFRPGLSDVNVLIVLHSAGMAELAALDGALKRWRRRGHTLPIICQPDELHALAQTYPIEFSDMIDHHRVLFGEDPLKDLLVDTQALGYQCRHDVSLIILKLRQAVALYAGDSKRLRKILIDSLPSVLTLMRAALRLRGSIPRLSKIEASERLAALAGFDALKLRQILDFHLQRSSDDIRQLLADYFGILEKVVLYLRQ
ncbi:MAG TPA: hypothetical protein VMU17_07710 [Elusimicrobiota bacterium]|nr:hypothetical protein [Elusimicrobiota bacterium]